MWARSLGWEDPLEEGMATHSCILAWRNPVDRAAWWATVHGITKTWMQLKRLNMYACIDLPGIGTPCPASKGLIGRSSRKGAMNLK